MEISRANMSAGLTGVTVDVPQIAAGMLTVY